MSSRKRTKAAGQPSTGPRRTTRSTRLTATLGQLADRLREPVRPEDEREGAHDDGEHDRADDRGGREHRVPPPPSMLRSVTATTGSRRFESWFQIPVIATARVTSPDAKPHARRSPYEPAMPTIAPPGAM